MEFKKLSAVEAVASVSDTASVLIEEDGVIKRAPKGEVGGVKVASTAEVGQTIVVKAVDEAGNPTEWECADLEKKPDMVITTCTETQDPTITADNFTITEGTVLAVGQAIMAGRPVVVIIRNISNDGYVYIAHEQAISANIYGEWLYLSYTFYDGQGNSYACRLALNIDGSFHSFKSEKLAFA